MDSSNITRVSGALLFCALCVLGAPALQAASLDELVGGTDADMLAGGETITSVQLKDPVPALAPNHSGVRHLVDGVMAELAPSLMAESLFRWPKPAAALDTDGGVWTERQRAALYNNVLALSSLEGIQYYSASRKKMRTFYEYSRVVSDTKGKTPLPDPSFDTPPAELTIYARQKDLSFGDNIYEYSFSTDRDYLIFTQENLTAMKYGIIPALGKNKLRSVVAVIDCGDSLLVYAVSMAKAATFPGLSERIGNSFSNRAAAILKWFAGRAKIAFGE